MKRKFARILIIMFLLFASTNCKKTERPVTETDSTTTLTPETTLTSLETQANPVIAPIDPIIYYDQNRINFTYENHTTEENAAIEYVSIHGLVDKSVEEKINNMIYETALKLNQKEMPPYRGVQRILNESGITISSYIHCIVSCNQSNVLSLTLNKTFLIESDHIDSSNSYSINDTIPLNFNLITGEQILLADLFADNCNYQEIINRAMAEHIQLYKLDYSDRTDSNYDFYFSTYLLSSFEGVNENSKYYITSYGNLNMILDYDTPEFRTNFSGDNIILDTTYLGIYENYALYHRFVTADHSIYDETVPEIKLLQHESGPTLSQSILKSAQDFNNIDDTLPVSSYFNSKIPQSIANPSLSQRFTEKSNQLEAASDDYFLSKIAAFPNQSLETRFDYYVYQCGPYYVVSETAFAYTSTEFQSDVSRYTVYNITTGEILTPDDYFTAGLDYKSRLVELLRSYFSMNTQLTFTDEELLEIASTSRYLPSVDQLILEYGEGEEQQTIQLYYQSIGYEYLAAFN